ncbi:rhamnulokinase [Vibrio scophthalmi]|uniref:rhamnulokinase n=1 Tax=Vibrio scophthalmi TaxID=45658 RepID=UPI002FF17C02
MQRHVIAIDIGASSGRVMLGTFDGQRLSLDEQHRFTNQLVSIQGQDCWDIDALFEQVCIGIDVVLESGIHPASIGIDTWGVDFVLLDKQGQRHSPAVSYRDTRTQGVMEQLLADTLDRKALYQTTGIQFLPFNTLYQLCALPKESLSDVASLLLIPDYLNYRLTGVKHCEYTNASTTQLLDCRTKQWSQALLDRIGIPSDWFLEPKAPNQIIGEYKTVPVASIASHDTASAVLGTPLQSDTCAYLCSGTWSLMGYESDHPTLNDEAVLSNVTNEGGAGGTYRTLKNIMGLWLIQSIQKLHSEHHFAQLVEMAQQSPAFEFLIDPDSACFLNPDNMEHAIVDFCQRTGQGTPQTLAQIARCIFDSLALRYAQVFAQLNHLAPKPLTAIHVVGGGANNHFLNQLCANTCQVPVLANPTEASALGNMMGQLIATGAVDSIEHGREIIAHSFELTQFSPTPISQLDALQARFDALTQ